MGITKYYYGAEASRIGEHNYSEIMKVMRDLNIKLHPNRQKTGDLKRVQEKANTIKFEGWEKWTQPGQITTGTISKHIGNMRKEILKICSYYQVQWHKELDIQRFIDLKNYHQEYNRLNRERGVVFSILFLILGLIILPFGLIFVLPSVWYLYKFITSKEEREQKRRILIQNIQRVFLD